jgi:hypothetical protein
LTAGNARPSEEPDAAILSADIDAILERLDAGIAREKKAWEELLSRLRTTKIAA